MIHYLRAAKEKDLRGVALLRLDFNTKSDDWRMRAVIPSVRLLAKTARAVVIMSHRGRPLLRSQRATQGRLAVTKSELREFSLRKDAANLARLLGKKVTFVPDFDFEKIKAQIDAADRGSIFLLENLRFMAGEATNDATFARSLASLADSPAHDGYYVNDAFAVSHRKAASVSAITKLLPSYAGLELEDEIKNLSRVTTKFKKPLVLVVGGAKAADKLGVLKFFEKKAAAILLGGGSANTILALRGMDVKKSLRDTDAKDLRALAPLATRHNIVAPVDYIWSGGKILDIGTQSIKDFCHIIAGAQTIIMSGPLGMTDDARFDKGTLTVSRAIAAATTHGAFSLAGGGETVEFLKKHHLDKKFSFISTGGGAMLDYLAGKKLPGIIALNR